MKADLVFRTFVATSSKKVYCVLTIHTSFFSVEAYQFLQEYMPFCQTVNKTQAAHFNLIYNGSC